MAARRLSLAVIHSSPNRQDSSGTPQDSHRMAVKMLSFIKKPSHRFVVYIISSNFAKPFN